MEPSTTKPSILAIAMHYDVIDDCWQRLENHVPTYDGEAVYAVKQLKLIQQHAAALVEQLQDFYNLPRG